MACREGTPRAPRSGQIQNRHCSVRATPFGGRGVRRSEDRLLKCWPERQNCITQLTREKGLPRRVCTASGKVATEFQSDSSRTDSPVRILHAQPRSPLSVAHIRHLKKFTTFYTVSTTKARAAASRGVALARTISSVPRLALRQHLALNWV